MILAAVDLDFFFHIHYGSVLAVRLSRLLSYLPISLISFHSYLSWTEPTICVLVAITLVTPPTPPTPSLFSRSLSVCQASIVHLSFLATQPPLGFFLSHSTNPASCGFGPKSAFMLAKLAQTGGHSATA